MRRKVIAGNWKMNKLPDESMKFIDTLSQSVKDTNHEVILCVPYTDLFYSLMTAQETNIKIGAQNMHFEENGAFTGEISPKMLKSIGVEYVIIGHSERRQYFNETDETVNLKIKAAIKNALKPIVCVGESLEQRESNIAVQVVVEQLNKAFENIEAKDLENIIIAYEPIWAIGTGKTATSEDANNMCREIRNQISKIYDKDVSEKIIIQYGGSVKSSNSKELFSTSDIDGALIGGASLDATEFAQIVKFEK